MDSPVDRLLREGPIVINIGLRDFAASLQAQGVQVIHVEWSPPGGGDEEMIDLLDRLL